MEILTIDKVESDGETFEIHAVNPEIFDNPEFLESIKPDMKSLGIKEMGCTTPVGSGEDFYKIWMDSDVENNGSERDDSR